MNNNLEFNAYQQALFSSVRRYTYKKLTIIIDDFISNDNNINEYTQ